MSEMKALVDAVDAVTSRKRGNEDETVSAPAAASAPKRGRRSKNADLSPEERAEQTRTFAIESRKRKKEMVDDIHRSIAFFSSANENMKNENAELERQIIIAKQRILLGEKGIPVAAPSLQMQADLLSLLKSSKPSAEAEFAHFTATQAMYKTMGFPPRAAKEAAKTFAACGYSAKSSAFPSVAQPSSKKSPSPSANGNQAHAAHFAATQALYKSMGFPPKAAKEAATTFSNCGQASKMAPTAKPAASPPSAVAQYKIPQLNINSGESYVDALNRFAMQQAAAAKAAAAMAAAAMQAAKHYSQNNGTGVGAAPVPASVMPAGLPYGNGLNDLIAMLQANNESGGRK